jgi:thymidine kinase
MPGCEACGWTPSALRLGASPRYHPDRAMHVIHGEIGWIELICGPMFSGKSEELIRRLKRARIARQPLQCFKPRIDDRYHGSKIVSHSEHSIEAVAVSG